MNLILYFLSLLVPLAFLSGVAGLHVYIRGYDNLAGGVSHFFFGPYSIAYLLGYATTIDIPHLYLTFLFVIPLVFVIPLKPGPKKEVGEQSRGRVNILWSLGMSAGLLIIFLIPSFVNIEGLLFGTILLVDNTTILFLWCFSFVVLILQLVFHNYFKYLPLYEEMEITGYRPQVYHRIQLFICVGSILLILNAVGIVLLVTILTIPTLIATRFGNQYTMLLLLSIALEGIFLIVGVGISFLVDVQASPVIATFILVVFLIVSLVERILKQKTA